MRRWGGAERRVGRGLKENKDNDDDDGTQKISKRKSTPKKGENVDVQQDSDLHVSPGPSQDLIWDDEIIQAGSKAGKRKVKKWGDPGASPANVIYGGKVLCLPL